VTFDDKKIEPEIRISIIEIELVLFFIKKLYLQYLVNLNFWT